MTKDKKYMYVGIGLLLVTLILSGVTYAVLTWTSTKTNIGINTDCFTIDYTKGDNITGKLKLLNESELITNGNQFTIKEGVGISYINIGIKSTCNIEGYGSIYLNVTELSDSFKGFINGDAHGDSYKALKYVLLKNSTDYETKDLTIDNLINKQFEIVEKGEITNIGKELIISKRISKTIDKYIIVIYIDNKLAGNNILTSTFKGNISAEAEQEHFTSDECFNIETNDETKTATISDYKLCETNVVIPQKISKVSTKKVLISNPDSQVITNCATYLKEEGLTYELDEIKKLCSGETIDGLNLQDILNEDDTPYNIIQDLENIGIVKITKEVSKDKYTVTAIGKNAFFGNQLTSVTIPDSVIEIGDSAFCNNKLTSIVIPDSVTTIGSSAFSHNRLTNIIIPASVTTIGGGAFLSNNLINIKVDENNSTYDSRENSNAIIETATNTIIQACKNTTIPTSITAIGESAFNGCGIKNLDNFGSITTIGREAFKNNKITNLIIPDSVTTIGYSAFAYNDLNYVVISENSKLTNIDGSAFLSTKTNTPSNVNLKTIYNNSGKALTFTYAIINNTNYRNNTLITGEVKADNNFGKVIITAGTP